jgi:hypothetical protein
MVRALLARGSEINVKPKDGKRALKLAGRKGRTQLVHLLEKQARKNRSVFIFLCAGYSTHKRFVLGGEECAAPFVCKTLVSCETLMAYFADGCSLVDKGQVGYGL